MRNLDGQYQGGHEGEKYPKTTRTGKATKKQKKGSLEESCESLIVGTADGREERFLMCELIYLNTSYKAIKPYSLIEMAKFCYTSGTVLKLQ